jgi:hypothetical protein
VFWGAWVDLYWPRSAYKSLFASFSSEKEDSFVLSTRYHERCEALVLALYCFHGLGS